MLDLGLHRADVAALAAVTYSVFTMFFMDLPVAGLRGHAWARASGMYTSGGCSPAAGDDADDRELVFATVTVEPTFSLFAVA